MHRFMKTETSLSDCSVFININVLCNTVFYAIKFRWLFTSVKRFLLSVAFNF